MKDKRQSTDPWVAGITRALRRASDRALRLSQATGTPFWVMKNGRMVNLNPKAKGRRQGGSRSEIRVANSQQPKKISR